MFYTWNENGIAILRNHTEKKTKKKVTYKMNANSYTLY